MFQDNRIHHHLWRYAYKGSSCRVYLWYLQVSKLDGNYIFSCILNFVRFIRHFEFCLVEGPGPEEENQQLTNSWPQHNQEKFVCCAWWSPSPAAMTPGLKREFNKGTVSRDGFCFWWHVWIVFGLIRVGRGHFLKF